MTQRDKQEEYRQWEPVRGVPEVLYCEAIIDDDAGVQIILTGGSKGPRIRIVFDSVIAYRNVNETYRYRTWATHRERRGSLTIVDGSNWIEWLKEESNSLLPADSVVHYAIYTPEDCIDIVSLSAPLVEYIDGTRVQSE